jgi:glycosyltransferase involved in cell wall biosynthesis
MKRIAIYIDVEYHGSGVSQYIKSLTTALIHLSHNNYELTIIYTRKSWDTYFKKHSDLTKVFFKETRLLSILYQFLISTGIVFFAKLAAHIFDSKVKFIEKKNFNSVIFPASDTIACLVNAKIIGTIHDLMHRYERNFKESGSFLRSQYRENYYKKLLKISKAVFVDSQLGKNQVIESYKSIKSKILPLPYIAPDYIYSTDIVEVSETIQKIPSQEYLFYPATFWPHKNHINLIKAILILNERGLIINLLFGGSKKLEYKKILKFVNENNLEEQVKFLGYISDSDMIYLYKNAFAMIMPTFYGPTNIPPIEAIILDCPPIVSNNYAMPEQLENAALYFNPANILEIADAIEFLYKNNELKNQLIKNGNLLKEKFSQKRFESDLKIILENLNEKLRE